MRIVKLHIVFAAFLLIASSGSIAQVVSKVEIPDILKTKISIDVKDVTFEDALKIVARKGRVNFNYNNTRVPFSKTVSIKMENAVLFDVIVELMKQTGTELQILENKQLIIVPKEESKGKNNIKGKVIDKQTGEPLTGTNIFLRGTDIGATTDNEGNYEIQNIPAGGYELVVSFIGYRTEEIKNILFMNDSQNIIDVGLEEEPVSLSTITVTPASFSIMGNGPVLSQVLTKEQYHNLTFAEDAYRAIRRLPGISSNDFSAKFTVRGGESDEILVLLDGLELYEPFHMKDIMGGLLSIVDVQAIGGMELLMGGFTSEYGSRISGVFNIETMKPGRGEKKIFAGISMMNARVMSSGSFDDGKGGWLFSARRGYLDLVFDIINKTEDPFPNPTYFDVLAKAEYKILDKHSLSFNLLHAEDDLDYTEDDADRSSTSYGNSYGWLTLKSFPSSKLYVQTVGFIGNVKNSRWGIGYFGSSQDVEFEVNDQRNFNMHGIKQDWNLELTDNYHLKWGFDYKSGSASYDYLGIKNEFYITGETLSLIPKTTDIEIEPSGEQYSLYLSNKVKIIEPLILELGIRYDKTSYTDEDLISPRVNLFYAIGKRTYIRGALGMFNQSQELNELRVQMGERFFNAAQLSNHYLLGFEHHFLSGVNLRVEAYYKSNSRKKPDYRQYAPPVDIEMFPEMSYENIKFNIDRSVSKGIEVYLKYDTGGAISFWGSYALSSVEDFISNVEYAGNNIPVYRSFPGVSDQRHTFYFDLNYRPDENWHINVAWQFHSGWPYSGLSNSDNMSEEEKYQAAMDNYLQSNYPSYHRLDVRVNRYFDTSIGRISLFVELINLYSRDNVRAYDYIFSQDTLGRERIQKQAAAWLPLLPSIGFSWEYDF